MLLLLLLLLWAFHPAVAVAVGAAVAVANTNTTGTVHNSMRSFDMKKIKIVEYSFKCEVFACFHMKKERNEYFSRYCLITKIIQMHQE